MHEIKTERGLAGILELSERGKSSWVIGVLVASSVLIRTRTPRIAAAYARTDHRRQQEVHSHKNLIAGALRSLGDDKREAVLKGVTAGLSEEDMAQLLVLAPFGKSTWKLVDALGEAAQGKYWSEVTPDWTTDAEKNEGVERLMKAERPRAAFSFIQFKVASSMRRFFSACYLRWRKAAKISLASTCLSTTGSRRRSSI